jgi:hypothetical protein
MAVKASLITDLTTYFLELKKKGSSLKAVETSVEHDFICG